MAAGGSAVEARLGLFENPQVFTEADRLRSDLVGVHLLALLSGDKLVGTYGRQAQKISDFAPGPLDRCYRSVKDTIGPAPQ